MASEPLSHPNFLHSVCSCHAEGIPTAAAAAFCVHPSLSNHCLMHTLYSFGILVGGKEKVRAMETNDSTKYFCISLACSKYATYGEQLLQLKLMGVNARSRLGTAVIWMQQEGGCFGLTSADIAWQQSKLSSEEDAAVFQLHFLLRNRNVS